jgi:multiple sugar transport system ATP-binding protein
MGSITLEHVNKSFGEVQVIPDISLDIKDGEFVVFVGPSGCGKSTLLRLIAGLEDTTSGHIKLDGEDVTAAPPARRGLAMVFQSYALYPHMSVRDNIAFPLKMAKTPQAIIDQKVDYAARTLNLTSYLDRRPRALSGGQRQRVAIGRAIVREPKAFLFDEPLSNLDAALRVNMRLEITELHQQLKTTMIYVTHDQVEAMTMADRIVVLNAGNVEQFGSPLELYKRPANRFVAGFIGSPGMNFMEGKVEQVGGEWVFTTADLSIPLSRYRFQPSGPRAGNAVLGIRPEHVGMNIGTDWPVSRQTRVDVVEPMGADTLVWTRLADQDFTVKVPTERAPDHGNEVTLGFDPMNASLFDAVTDERL